MTTLLILGLAAAAFSVATILGVLVSGWLVGASRTPVGERE